MKNKIILFIIFFIFFLQPHFFDLKSESHQERKEQEALKHEVEVRLVMVDVIVTKQGKFVTDLTKQDFELYEDGKRVTINSLELISYAERKTVTLAEKPEKEISPGVPTRKLAVVVDAVNSRWRHTKRGSKKIIGELLSLVKLGHEVMIICLNVKKGVEILQPFTTDEKLIRKAVEKAGGNIWVEKALDSVRMAQKLGIESTRDQAQAQRLLGRPEVKENLLQEYWLSEQQRFEISLGGILAVFNMIKDLPGRKSILLISDGLPELPSDRLTKGQVPPPVRFLDLFDALKKKKNVAGYEVIKELVRYANAQNISIYTLDPGTFSEHFFTVPFEIDEYDPTVPRQIEKSVSERIKEVKIKKAQNLRWISEDTGAVWLRGAKKYDRFRKILTTDLNYYYQLSYYPPRERPDNKYHKIEVKVKRSGVDTRFRRGYTDYSQDEEAKMLLSSAFYNPELYKKLPFEAEFIPFSKNPNKYKPWMSIALPMKKLFFERSVTYGSKNFNLHIFVKDKKRGASVHRGQMNIPFNINASFMDLLETADYFCFHFTGAEIEFSQKEYQVIFILYDDQTEEIGTWESSFSLPDFKENKQGALINCVLGSLTLNPEGGKSFSLSKKGGSLECGEMKFFPAVTHRFQRMQDASVFLQAYLSQGKIILSPQFTLLREGIVLQNIPGEIVAEAWNETSKVWSAIFDLYLSDASPGDYTLRVNLPLSDEGPVLSNDIKLIKLDY